MTDAVKRRSLMVLEALESSANECEAYANEMVQMLIRGDDNRRVPMAMMPDVESIKDAVDEIKSSITNLTLYVNRKQETHRLNQ